MKSAAGPSPGSHPEQPAGPIALRLPRDARGVRALFDTVGSSYDQFSRWLSLGMDARWKRAVRAATEQASLKRHLDLACGTGDLLFAPESTGVDFSRAMLSGARRRDGRSPLVEGDLLCLPFADRSAGVVTAAYAFRNVVDVDRALAEVRRVLRPDGLLVTLDFYRPPSPGWRALFEGYLTVAGHAAGWVVHRNAGTYGHIARSLRRWCTSSDFSSRLAAHGFTATARPYLGGGIAIHTARLRVTADV